MVGMNMRVDDEANVHAGACGRAQVRLDVADRVDDGTSRLAATAKVVRDANRVSVKELTEDHGTCALLRGEINDSIIPLNVPLRRWRVKHQPETDDLRKSCRGGAGARPRAPARTARAPRPGRAKRRGTLGTSPSEFR